MYCSKCGHKLLDDARFCYNCGTEQNPRNTTNDISLSKDHDILERNAMRIYLSNILSLECLKEKLYKSYSNKYSTWEYESSHNLIKAYQFQYGYITLAYSDGVYCVACYEDNGCRVGDVREHSDNDPLFHWNCMSISKGFGREKSDPYSTFIWVRIDKKSLYEMQTTSFWGWVGGDNFLEKLFRQSKAKAAFMNAYSDFLKTAPKEYQENLGKTINPLKEQVDNLFNEYTKAEALLNEAYSINILPQQYRNIYAVWFINDFISTSNENLTSALLHCDLDNIKQKLDTIIEQQREIIINQAIQISQNEQLIKQNQQTLLKLSNIESNTEKSAQYSKMAATNAEACAWIGMANYLLEK